MNTPNNIAALYRRCRGFGLIELMVSIVISMLLLAVVSGVYLSSKQTFNVSNNVARLQENSRFALWFINHDLRMAGYSGCTRTIGNLLDTAAPGYDPNLYDPNQVVGGWNFDDTEPGDVYAISTLDPTTVTAGDWEGLATGSDLAADFNGRNLVPGSDVLVVKRANTLLSLKPSGTIALGASTFNVNDGREQSSSGQPRVPAIEQFDLLVLSTCQQADLFQNTSNTDSNPDLNPKPISRTAGSGIPGNQDPTTKSFGTSNPLSPLSPTYGDETEVYAFTSNAYYVATGSTGEPTLFRLSFSNGQPPAPGDPDNPQELVEGVENMQVLYGEDTDGDDTANRYVAADEVTNPAAVVAVRVGLLMRAPTQNEDFIDGKQFFVADNIEIQPVVDPNHLRYIASSTVQLRNLGL